MSTKIIIEVSGNSATSSDEVQRLRAALQPFADLVDDIGPDLDPDKHISFRAEYLIAARDALKGGGR